MVNMGISKARLWEIIGGVGDSVHHHTTPTCETVDEMLVVILTGDTTMSAASKKSGRELAKKYINFPPAGAFPPHRSALYAATEVLLLTGGVDTYGTIIISRGPIFPIPPSMLPLCV